MSRTRYPAVEAVGVLIATRAMRVDITPTVSYPVRAPCLLRQLGDALAIGSESGGRGIPSSRPLIAPDAWDLWQEIRRVTIAWARALGVDAGRYLLPGEPAGELATPPVGRLLHAVAIRAATTRPGPRGADVVQRRAREWAGRIEALLVGTVQERALRGAGCPACTTIRPYPRRLIGPRSGPQPTITVIEHREEEGRMVPYTVPAIVLVLREYGDVLAWLVCRACGWTRPLAGVGSELVASSDTGAPLDADDREAA